MTETDIKLIRTLGEFLPPDVIERWIEDEKKKLQQEKIDNRDDN